MSLATIAKKYNYQLTRPHKTTPRAPPVSFYTSDIFFVVCGVPIGLTDTKGGKLSIGSSMSLLFLLQSLSMHLQKRQCCRCTLATNTPIAPMTEMIIAEMLSGSNPIICINIHLDIYFKHKFTSILSTVPPSTKRIQGGPSAYDDPNETSLFIYNEV